MDLTIYPFPLFSPRIQGGLWPLFWKSMEHYLFIRVIWTVDTWLQWATCPADAFCTCFHSNSCSNVPDTWIQEAFRCVTPDRRAICVELEIYWQSGLSATLKGVDGDIQCAIWTLRFQISTPTVIRPLLLRWFICKSVLCNMMHGQQAGRNSHLNWSVCLVNLYMHVMAWWL